VRYRTERDLILLDYVLIMMTLILAASNRIAATIKPNPGDYVYE